MKSRDAGTKSICKHFCLQASFVATGNRTDISLEDPDFWQKWAKKAELDLDAINGRVCVIWFAMSMCLHFAWMCVAI